MKLRPLLGSFSSSLTARCLTIVLAYALSLLALVFIANTAVEARLTDAFPTIEAAIEQEDALAHDRFDVLAGQTFSRCHLEVFDQNGQRLYASSNEIADSVRASDLPLINEYDVDDGAYEVFAETDETGGLFYRIALVSYDRDNNARRIDASCTLDENLNRVEGSLFAEQDRLTEREFEFIRGMYEEKMTIEKYEYATAEGEPRTLVFAAPIVNEAAYVQAIENANLPWLIVAPLALAATALAAIAIVRTTKRAVRPLDAAIAARKNSSTASMRPLDLPVELRPTFESFVGLMDQLDAAQQEKQRLIADVSHDLKTPLTVIRGYAQALVDGRVPADRQEPTLRAISEKTVAASDLIDALFEFATLEHPGFRANRAPVDACELVRRLAIDRSADIEQAGCTLETTIADEPSVILADERLFERMVSNLVTNACKHNPAGTRIRLGCAQENGRVTVTVSDTGIGIPDELKARAFEPFVTGNTARTPGKGTGLGLSIARHCANLNDATIEFAERPDEPYRTMVRITFARADRAE